LFIISSDTVQSEQLITMLNGLKQIYFFVCEGITCIFLSKFRNCVPYDKQSYPKSQYKAVHSHGGGCKHYRLTLCDAV